MPASYYIMTSWGFCVVERVDPGYHSRLVPPKTLALKLHFSYLVSHFRDREYKIFPTLHFFSLMSVFDMAFLAILDKMSAHAAIAYDDLYTAMPKRGVSVFHVLSHQKKI